MRRIRAIPLAIDIPCIYQIGSEECVLATCLLGNPFAILISIGHNDLTSVYRDRSFQRSPPGLGWQHLTTSYHWVGVLSHKGRALPCKADFFFQWNSSDSVVHFSIKNCHTTRTLKCVLQETCCFSYAWQLKCFHMPQLLQSVRISKHQRESHKCKKCKYDLHPSAPNLQK